MDRIRVIKKHYRNKYIVTPRRAAVNKDIDRYAVLNEKNMINNNSGTRKDNFERRNNFGWNRKRSVYLSVTIDLSVISDDGEDAVFFIGGEEGRFADPLETSQRYTVDVIVFVGDDADIGR